MEQLVNYHFELATLSTDLCSVLARHLVPYDIKFIGQRWSL